VLPCILVVSKVDLLTETLALDGGKKLLDNLTFLDVEYQETMKKAKTLGADFVFPLVNQIWEEKSLIADRFTFRILHQAIMKGSVYFLKNEK
jgi:hypothetical protein